MKNDKASKRTTQPRRSQEERRLATRARLIQAVIDAVQERGYAALRTKDIIRQAEMTWGAAQYIFGDKDELLLQSAIKLSEELVARLNTRIDVKRPLKDRARQVIRQTWLLYSSPYHFAMAEIGQGKRFDPAFHDRLVDAQFRVHNEIERQWLKIFADSGIPEDRLMMICNTATVFLSGLSARKFYLELRDGDEEMLEYFTDQLVRMLMAETSAKSQRKPATISSFATSRSAEAAVDDGLTDKRPNHRPAKS